MQMKNYNFILHGLRAQLLSKPKFGGIIIKKELRTLNRTENEDELYGEIDELEQRVQTLESLVSTMDAELKEIKEAIKDVQKA
jgi:chaperonin cofactor prefoldin